MIDIFESIFTVKWYWISYRYDVKLPFLSYAWFFGK